MKKPRWGVACLVVVTALMSVSSSAVAAQFTVGQTASAANPPANCVFTDPSDEIQLGAAVAPQYFIASPGLITSWSTFAHPGPGQSFNFKVFRKVAPFTYLVVAQESRPLASGVLNTFPVAIPVQKGDFIGSSQPGGGTVSSPCVFETGSESDTILYAEGSNAPAGSNVVFPGTVEKGYRLNVSATVLPPPAITAITPATGSVKGVPIAIQGDNFANVTGVSFGSVPAARFTVDSETQITAVAPPSRRIASVPVTVTTGAGSAASAQTFAYEGCVVPKLKGKNLKASKRKLRRSDCRVGKVKKLHDATAKTGKVVKQSPKPGRVLPPGARVKVTLDKA